MSTVINEVDALERLGDDRELFLELLGVFLEECDSMTGALRSAVESSNASAVDRAAHTMKGACSNISAERARDIAYKLEAAGKSGDIAEAPTLLAQLEDAITELRAEAQRLIDKGV